jgi:GntR family transcriptional regulator of vanillate catabolism
LILKEAASPILADAIDRVVRIPFGGPQALAFDRSPLDEMYDMLHYAHRQHHGIADALERGQSGRAEALMREHAGVVKESLNIASLRVATADSGRIARAV